MGMGHLWHKWVGQLRQSKYMTSVHELQQLENHQPSQSLINMYCRVGMIMKCPCCTQYLPSDSLLSFLPQNI